MRERGNRQSCSVLKFAFLGPSALGCQQLTDAEGSGIRSRILARNKPLDVTGSRRSESLPSRGTAATQRLVLEALLQQTFWLQVDRYGT